MVELGAITITWALVSLSGVMSPGPLSALVLTEGTTRGIRAGPLISTGHSLTEALMVAGLGIGLSQVLQHPLVAGMIGVAGGLFLLWMSADLAVRAWQGRLALERAHASDPGATRLNLVSAGILVTIFNPYWLLWWATVGSATMIQFLPFGWIGLAVFYFSHISLDYGWNTLLAVVGATGRRVMPDKVYRVLLITCGLFLVLMSVYFLWLGVNFLRLAS